MITCVACIMCRLEHALCVDFNMAYVQILTCLLSILQLLRNPQTNYNMPGVHSGLRYAGHQPSRSYGHGRSRCGSHLSVRGEAGDAVLWSFPRQCKARLRPAPVCQRRISVGSNLTILQELNVELTTPTGACGCAPASKQRLRFAAHTHHGGGNIF